MPHACAPLPSPTAPTGFAKTLKKNNPRRGRGGGGGRGGARGGGRGGNDGAARGGGGGGGGRGGRGAQSPQNIVIRAGGVQVRFSSAPLAVFIWWNCSLNLVESLFRARLFSAIHASRPHAVPGWRVKGFLRSQAHVHRDWGAAYRESSVISIVVLHFFGFFLFFFCWRSCCSS
jgi:hypothetical protein